MGRTPRSLLGLAAALGVVTAAVSITTATPAAAQSRAACDAALVAPQGSLIGGLWRSNGGQGSIYGCPVTKEFGYPDKRGSWQRFQNGKIVWSPNIGDAALVRAYYSGGKVVFRWSGTGRDWDFFQVRWSKDGRNTQQVKVARDTPWSGAYAFNPYVKDGVGTTTNGHEVNKFAFIVQGCDRSGVFQTSTDCGPWSIVTSVSVAH